MRRFYRDSDALDTINAAASVIASADNRVAQATPPPKRRWRCCWRIYWCFGSQRHRKRIGHAVLVPVNSSPGNDSSAPENPTQAPPPITLPFIAPPSSPASFLQSEPPSALQSPAGIISLTSMSASMYSPTGPASIFAIGPYAHETQLVSPPVFSTFTTEPSTAPFTPPPESVHLTTPSSPEVPFAQLLDPGLRNSGTGLQFPVLNYEFNSYQLYPGSPVGQLISPSSGVSGSGTSSPFPDIEFSATSHRFPEFHIPDPPKLLNLDNKEFESGHGSSNFAVESQFSDVASQSNSVNGKHNHQVPSQRVSFELAARREADSSELEQNLGHCVVETSNEILEKAPTNKDKASRHQKHRSLTLGSLKEFNFDSTNGGDINWWANGADNGKEDGTSKNWSFPVMQPNAN